MMNNLQSSAFVAKTTQLLSSVARLRLLLVMLLTLTASTAWGAEITFTPSSDKGSVTTNGTTDGDQVTKSGFTITSSNGVMGNGSNYRVYTNGTLSITSTVGNITAISFTFSSDDYTGSLNESYTGLSTASWSASATSQARITNITITYTPTSTTKYTVTLVPGSGSVTDTELEEPNAGEGVTLPTPTLDCGDWEFAGWKTTSAVTTETTTKPTLIAAGAYSPTSDITLYAVYKRTETTSGGGGGGEATAEVSIADYASANNWSDATKYTSVTIDENITATASSEGSNTGKYYTSGTNWRFYQTEEATLTLSAATGFTIKTVKVTYSVSKTGVLTYNGANVSSGTATAINATSATFGVGNTGSETNGQVRITAIEVIYTNSAGGTTSTTYYHSTPECSTETLVSVLPKIMNFWQSIFGVSLGYLRDKTGYRHVLGGIVVVSLHHRCTKIDFHHINMSRTAFVGLCLFVWQTTERFFV